MGARSVTKERNTWISEMVRAYNAAPEIPCGFKTDVSDPESACGRPADWQVVFDHGRECGGQHGFVCEAHRVELLAITPLRCVECGYRPAKIVLLEPLR